MKALSTTILIVVTAVVILVAALVVLTIFGGGVGNVAQMTDKRNNCITQCAMTCQTLGQMPPTWSATGCDKVQPQISQTTDCKCKCESGQVWCSAKNSCQTPSDCIK